MIARLANDDTQELLSADFDDARDCLAANVDQLISEARSRSWHERGRSQVVFNGPPAERTPGSVPVQVTP
jgi:hypothetical protein